MLSGVFERFPRLKFVMTELGCDWVPPLLSHRPRSSRRSTRPADRRARVHRRARARRLASEYFQRTATIGSLSPGPPTSRPHADARARPVHVGQRLPARRGHQPFTREAPAPAVLPTGPERAAAVPRRQRGELYDFDLDALAPLAAAVRPDRRRDRAAAHRAARRRRTRRCSASNASRTRWPPPDRSVRASRWSRDTRHFDAGSTLKVLVNLGAPELIAD